MAAPGAPPKDRFARGLVFAGAAGDYSAVAVGEPPCGRHGDPNGRPEAAYG
jgi:hypothetical protein